MKVTNNNNEIINYIGNNVKIGRNVKIWHFTYIGDDVKIGDNVSIGSLTHIDYKVEIGDNCRIQGSVYVPPFTIIKNDVFLGPGIIITNDPYPPSKKLSKTIIEEGAIIGAGSILKAGIRIGRNSVVAMGSLVTKDVLQDTVVMGNPAKPVFSRETYEKKRDVWEKII